ncbi:MAG TPA: hypothetical protein VH054_07755, partial [Polyangiaceae bacterium]|nr:hypothetical protein [Polyangiaceae bacterium]
MNRVAASILLAGVSVLACKKHDDAQVRPEPTQTQTQTQTPVASTDTSAVGVNAPSVSAANVVASVVASAAPSSSAASASGVQLGLNGLGNDPNAPTTPWGRDDLGGERGNMWGDAFGSGTGGLGSRTTDGGRLGGSRSTHTPKVRQGQTTVTGRL